MTFAHLQLEEPLLRALQKEQYKEPTPIQAKAIPHLLEGKDLIGIAQTGTGKTAAFVLPLLQRLGFHHAKPGRPHALILAPTRELAAQIAESCKTYGRFTNITSTVIFGGVGQGPQVQALRRGVDILIATPGRLLDLMEQGHIKLDKIEVFILDEADRMLDMGFVRDIRRLLPSLPRERQTLMFSATMSKEIATLAQEFLTEPERVAVTPEGSTRIKQELYFVDRKQKTDLLLRFVPKLDHVLIFTRTKHRADRVARALKKGGVKAEAIHGDKSQNQRTNALAKFQQGDVVLVATDIAARGIDVEGISHIINYDLPNEAENYVHRIGRTARAGASGIAYSFCDETEKEYLRAIEKLLGQRIPHVDHPFHSETARVSEQQPPKQGQRPARKASKAPGRRRAPRSPPKASRRPKHARAPRRRRPRLSDSFGCPTPRSSKS